MTELHPQESVDHPDNYKWKALFTTAMGALMTTMDFSITNIAFPTLTRIFEIEITTVMWVTLAYVLVSTSAMLILGRISDIVGRKIVFGAGMLIFTAALICCSLARSVEQLIVFRCFQGLGAAMNVSCGTAIVTEAFPARETGRGLGLLGISVSLGFIIGPVLGGFLLDLLDWRSIFYVRAPVCLLTLLLGIFLLKPDHRSSRSLRLDLRGALTSSFGIFCLVYGLSRTSGSGLLSPATLVWTGSGVFILGVFILLERTARDPIVDLSLFQNRTLMFASISMFLTFISAPPFFLIMPFYLIEGIRVTPSEAGLLLAANSVAAIICGPISGTLSDRFGARPFAAAGAAATVAAFLLMMFFDVHTGMPEIVAVLALLGIGIGMFQSPNSSMFMGSVPRDRVGSASALMATLRQVGISIGMALAGALYASRLASHQSAWVRQGAEGREAVRLSVPLAFHETLLFSIILGMVVIALCLVNRREPPEGA
jgi:EmrB/QacA subfamily drug resistance transporter